MAYYNEYEVDDFDERLEPDSDDQNWGVGE